MTIEKLKEAKNLGSIILALIQVPNTNLLQDTTSLSGISNPFVQSFIEFAPTIESEIISASVDPNCSCRTKIQQYVALYHSECAQFVFDYATIHKIEAQIDQYLEVTDKGTSPVDISGRVAQTPLSAWNNFTQSLSNVSFRGFSVVHKDADNLLVYFM
jgi:hypothetical protein